MVREDWLAKRAEPILEPGLPIVDAHHHNWERADARYLLPEMLADVQTGHNVRASVFVQCYAMYRAEGPRELRSLGETEFVNGLAAMAASGLYGEARLCAGIVGYVDLTLGEMAEPVLQRHIAAAGSRFKGIRHIVASHPDEAVRGSARSAPADLMRQPAFRRGFACLAPLGLSFDAWLYHTQLDDLLELAQAFPETRIVLNHYGGPLGVGPYAGRRDEVFAGWKAGIGRLAACPNLFVKLGGLAMPISGFGFHEHKEPPSSTGLADAWRPYFETCLESFGAARCMFESNFPVDKVSCSYAVLWNAFKRLAGGCSEDEKVCLFAGTASDFYRIALNPADGQA